MAGGRSIDDSDITDPFRARSASAPVALLNVNMDANGDRRIFGHHTSNNIIRAASRDWAP